MRKFTVRREYENDKLTKVTVEGVELPLGCKVVDYRVPNLNELFLGDDGTVVEEKEDLTCWPVPIIKDEIKELYGKPFNELVAPDGWEFTGEFRIPVVGVDWLMYSSGGIDNCVFEYVVPRLIVRKKAPPRRVVFEVIRENSIPKAEEYFTSDLSSSILGPCSGMGFLTERFVLRRIK
jgi:hypothetical protein